MPYCQDPAGQVSRSGIWAFRGLRKGDGKVGSGKWSTLSARAAHVPESVLFTSVSPESSSGLALGTQYIVLSRVMHG